MSYKSFGTILVDENLVDSTIFKDALPIINEISSYTAKVNKGSGIFYIIKDRCMLDNFAIAGKLLLSAIKELHLTPTSVTRDLVSSFSNFLWISHKDITKQGVVETLIDFYFTKVSKGRFIFSDLESRIYLIDSLILNCKSYNMGLQSLPYRKYDNLSRFHFVQALEFNHITDLDVQISMPPKINPLVSYGYNIIRDYAETLYEDLPYYRELGIITRFDEQVLVEFACCGLTKLQGGALNVGAVFSRLSNPQFWHAMGIVEGN